MSDEAREERAPDVVPSLSADLKRGSAWMVAMRWSIRLIGFVSTLILARLLDPSDFGIVAMASVVVGFSDAISSLGVDMALIQNTTATKRDFDTAWTVRIIQGVLVGGALIAAAPLAAKYFGEPRVEPVIWALAAGYVILSAENIGVVAFRRELDFARDFRFMVSKKLITFAITVGAALWLRSYWALVAGMVAGSILGCALGYAMHPYRPRFGLAGWSRLWSFSQWMLVRNIGGYALSRSDEFIVGGLVGARSMGLYSIASEISQLPTSELVAPMDRALFPGFALLQSHSARLRSAYLRVLELVSVLVIPIGLGLSVAAEPAVVVLLGAKWQDMAPIVSILSLAGVLAALRYAVGSVLTAIGDTRAVALMAWVQLLLFVGIALALGRSYGLAGVAWAKVIASLVMAPVGYGWLISRTAVRWGDLWQAVWRPCVGGIAMVVVVRSIPAGVVGGALPTLLLEVTSGALIYVAVLLACWFASGRPAGAERMILARLRLAAETA